MKFLIVFTCVLVSALAGDTPAYTGPQHIPVIGPNGVPIDTAEVQHARAAHHAKKIEAHIRNGDAFAYAPYAYAYAAHPVYADVHPFHAAHPVHAYPTTAVAPTIVDGVPQETPEVQAAKLNHFAAHADVVASTGYPFAVHYRRRRAAPVLAYSTPYVAPYSSFGYSTHTPHTYGYSHPYVHLYPQAHHYY